MRLPSAPFLEHRFYMDWLAQFPNGLNTVPWQAYPGHVPCTLPSPPGLKYQWDAYYDKAMYRQMHVSFAQRGRADPVRRRIPEPPSQPHDAGHGRAGDLLGTARLQLPDQDRIDLPPVLENLHRAPRAGCSLNQHLARRGVAEEGVRAGRQAVGARLEHHHQVAHVGLGQFHRSASRSSGVHSGPTTDTVSRCAAAPSRLPIATG